jgi:hypothetical protein
MVKLSQMLEQMNERELLGITDEEVAELTLVIEKLYGKNERF